MMGRNITDQDAAVKREELEVTQWDRIGQYGEKENRL